MRRLVVFLFAALLPVLAAPAISDGGVVNGADYTRNFSPGMVISIFGTDLAAATKKAPGFPLPNAIDGVSVEVIDGAKTLNAPLFFVSAGQINALLPYEIAGTSVQVRVRTAQGVSGAELIDVTPRCPRLLTKTMNGKGEAILTHANYTVVSEQSPAQAGEVLILFLTGLGAVDPLLASGQMAGDGSAGKPLNYVKAEVVVKVNGKPATVYFAGLAPYFAGLYQVNLKVPEATTPGTALIAVEVAGRASQEWISFACSMQWEALAAKAVGAEGGAVTAGTLTLAVPAGVMPSGGEVGVARALTGFGSERGQFSDVFGIGGLPSSFAGQLNVSIKLTQPLPAGAEVCIILRELGAGGGVIFVPAKLEGDRVVATLPPRSGAPASTAAAKAARRRASATDPPVEAGVQAEVSVEAAAYYLYKTPDGMFEITDISYFPGAARDLKPAASALTEAYGMLQEQGLSIPKDSLVLPIRVFLGAAPESESDCGGQVNLPMWTPREFGLHLAWWDESFQRAKTGHLLFHLLQTLLGFWTDPGRGPSHWWMDEAAATYFEQLMGTAGGGAYCAVDLVLGQFWWYAEAGLETSLRGEPLATRAHGRRMGSRFLEYVATTGNRPKLLGEIYTKWRAMGSAPYPVEVLQALGINVSAGWQGLVSRYKQSANLASSGSLACGIGKPVWNFVYGSGTGEGTSRKTVKLTEAAPVALRWDAMDLAARQFLVQMPATWPANASVRISTSPSTSVAVIAELVRDNTASSLQGPASGLTISNASSVFRSSDSLMLTVINLRAVSPYNITTPVTITVQVQTPLSFLPSLRTMTLVTASIDAAPTCTIDKDFQFLGLCPRALLVANNRVSVAGLAPFNPVNWDREFTTSDTGTLAGVSTNYTMSFKLSETGDAVQSSQVTSTATWRQAVGTKTYSMERKMNFSVADILHVIPLSPNNSTLLHIFQALPLNGAQPKNLLSWSYTITADGILVGSVTGIDWTRSLLADGKAVPRQSGTPGISIRFDK